MKKLILMSVLLSLFFLNGCINNNPVKPVEVTNNQDKVLSGNNEAPNQNILTGNEVLETVNNDLGSGQSESGIIEWPNSGELLQLECYKSPNATLTKKVQFTMSDFANPDKLAQKKKETINLINNCFQVEIVEEYEVQPGEVSTTTGKFANKILETDSIFSVIMFYSNVDVLDYEGFVGTQMVSYITNDDIKTVYDFYKSDKPTNFEIKDLVENKSVSFYNKLENITIKIVLTPYNGKTKIDYELIRIFDAGN